MRLGMIGDLIAHARRKVKDSTVGELGVETARDAKQDVPLLAPMVSAISGRIFDKANADWTEVTRAPCRAAGLARMVRRLGSIPICRAEWKIGDLHRYSCWSCTDFTTRIASRATAESVHLGVNRHRVGAQRPRLNRCRRPRRSLRRDDSGERGGDALRPPRNYRRTTESVVEMLMMMLVRVLAETARPPPGEKRLDRLRESDRGPVRFAQTDRGLVTSG